MDLEPANGGTDELPRINGRLDRAGTPSPSSSARGSSRAVVERDGENGLLTFEAIEASHERSGASSGVGDLA